MCVEALTADYNKTFHMLRSMEDYHYINQGVRAVFFVATSARRQKKQTPVRCGAAQHEVA